MSTSTNRTLSTVCYVAGFASIAASIAVWFFHSSTDQPHAERLAIFVGLWAPTFLIISDRLLKPIK